MDHPVIIVIDDIVTFIVVFMTVDFVYHFYLLLRTLVQPKSNGWRGGVYDDIIK